MLIGIVLEMWFQRLYTGVIGYVDSEYDTVETGLLTISLQQKMVRINR